MPVSVNTGDHTKHYTLVGIARVMGQATLFTADNALIVQAETSNKIISNGVFITRKHATPLALDTLKNDVRSLAKRQGMSIRPITTADESAGRVITPAK